MGLQLIGNIDRTALNRGLVVSSTTLNPKATPQMVAGDSVTVDVFLTGQNGALNIQEYSLVRLGIGTVNGRPTGGTWNYGSADNLAYNVDASTLEAAIEVETAPCQVTELAPFVFKVLFDGNGEQVISLVDSTNLTPASTVSIRRLVTGDSTTREQWLVRSHTNPIALIDSGWENIDGDGIRGTFNLGTAGIYDLLGASGSGSTSLELEVTSASGNIQTIFTVPLTITGEVIGEGATGEVAFSSYVTNKQLTTSTYNLDVNGIKGRNEIEIAYEAPSTSSWLLKADIGAKFSILESFGSEEYPAFVVDRFSNVEINTLTLATNNRYDARNNPSYTTVREFQNSLISDDGVVPTSSAVQKYIAETSPITVITGTGGETYSRYKSDWLKSDIDAIETSFGTSNVEAVRFGSEVESINAAIFKNRAGLKFVDFGQYWDNFVSGVSRFH
jgi:hypothetical protein